MNFLIRILKKSCDNAGIDLLKLAVLATFFTLVGDFFAFLGAVLELQEEEIKNSEKKQLQQQIYSIQKELERISKSI